jgi:hypothetical protein
MHNEVKKNKIWQAAVLVLLMGVIYEVHRWGGLSWHDICTRLHEDWFEHSGYIKVITSTIWEVVVLVLPMETIYDEWRWDDLRWHDTHVYNKIHDDRFRKSSNIKVITSTVWDAVVLVLLVTGSP